MKFLIKVFCFLIAIVFSLTGCTSNVQHQNNDENYFVDKLISKQNKQIINLDSKYSDITVKLKWAIHDGVNIYLLITVYQEECILKNVDINNAYISYDEQQVGFAYKKDVLIDGEPSCIMKFEVNTSTNKKLIFSMNSINGIKGNWNIDFQTTASIVHKHDINQNFQSEKMDVFIEYIENTNLQTTIKCSITIAAEVMPLIHYPTCIKAKNNEYRYIEGSGEGKVEQNNYFLIFDSIGESNSIVVYIELKSGEKINIPLSL